MEHNLPDFKKLYPYICEEFLENILIDFHDDPLISVDSFTVEAALGKGENYTSQMLRVFVNYRDKANDKKLVQLVIKAAIVLNQQANAIIQELDLFKKEIYIYSVLIPAVEKLFKSMGENIEFSPK